MNIIDILSNYFIKKNIKQKDIQKITGLCQSKISLTFNKKRKLSAEELIKIMVAFDIDLESIKKEIIL